MGVEALKADPAFSSSKAPVCSQPAEALNNDSFRHRGHLHRRRLGRVRRVRNCVQPRRNTLAKRRFREKNIRSQRQCSRAAERRQAPRATRRATRRAVIERESSLGNGCSEAHRGARVARRRLPTLSARGKRRGARGARRRLPTQASLPRLAPTRLRGSRPPFPRPTAGSLTGRRSSWPTSPRSTRRRRSSRR